MSSALGVLREFNSNFKVKCLEKLPWDASKIAFLDDSHRREIMMPLSLEFNLFRKLVASWLIFIRISV